MNNNDNNIQDLQEMQLQCSEYQEKNYNYTLTSITRGQFLRIKQHIIIILNHIM